jgi:hypothetical protein
MTTLTRKPNPVRTFKRTAALAAPELLLISMLTLTGGFGFLICGLGKAGIGSEMLAKQYLRWGLNGVQVGFVLLAMAAKTSQWRSRYYNFR